MMRKPGLCVLAICLIGVLASGGVLLFSQQAANNPDEGPVAKVTPTELPSTEEPTAKFPGTILIVPNEDGKVYLASGETIDGLQISEDSIYSPQPVLSPEGSRIAYRALDGLLRVYDISSRETTVYPEVDISGLAPLGWSPDGEQIVYSRSVAPSEICLFNLASAENFCFSEWNNDPVGSYGGYRFAGWSSDGEKMGVLFLGEPGEYEEGVQTYLLGSIYILDLVDNSLTLVIGEEDLAEIDHLSAAMLSPDGQSFLFTANSGEFDAVYAVIADGTGLRRVTNEAYPSILLNPVWSPDGKGFALTVPAKGSEFDESALLPTIFDLSGQIVEQIPVEDAQVSSWIN